MNNMDSQTILSRSPRNDILRHLNDEELHTRDMRYASAPKMRPFEDDSFDDANGDVKKTRNIIRNLIGDSKSRRISNLEKSILKE